jgi:hypothetical protein
MKRVALALLVGLAGAGLLTACRTMGVNGLAYKGKKDVDVYLAMKNGICQVKEPVDDLGGPKGRKISWTVKNLDCPSPQYVTFGEYKEHLKAGGYGPVDHGVVDPDLAASKQIPKDKTDTVMAKIAKEAKATDILFKYKICVSPFGGPATCLDPDIDVWP